VTRDRRTELTFTETASSAAALGTRHYRVAVSLTTAATENYRKTNMIHSVLRVRLAIKAHLVRLSSCGTIRFCHKLQPGQVTTAELGKPLQLTLAIIKPHVCKDPFSLQV